VFPDGREVAAIPIDEFFSSEELILEIVAEDQAFVLNQLEMLNEGAATERFSGRLDVDHVGTFGDSWGAWATMVASLRDSRFKAAVPCMSHSSIPSVVRDAGLDLPIMFLDPEREKSIQAMGIMRGPAYRVTLNGVTSVSVGDFALWPGISDTPRMLAALDDVEPVRAMEIVNTYMLAFFDRYLRDEEAPLLDSPSPEYPEVEIEIHNIQD
jgi:hypothetical protein